MWWTRMADLRLDLVVRTGTHVYRIRCPYTSGKFRVPVALGGIPGYSIRCLRRGFEYMSRRISYLLLSAAFLAACPSAVAQVSFAERDNLLYFGNDRIELVLDASNGFFRSIRNKQTGTAHKPPEDGVWPFGAWVGTREQPEQMKAEIRAVLRRKCLTSWSVARRRPR